MGSHECVDGQLDDSKYSSPMPVIGSYIAGATLVCFLSILFDIISGFRNKKQWLPCRFFSLNSITLTLLSIATKIPVDLTTTMPSPQDQLSKLTGTTLISISMGFLMPSLGISRPSECTTDMAAMTILVITVIINICIQLSTGVVILFRVEHVIILCCMFLMLIVLLCCAYDINSQKGVLVNQNKDLFTKGRGSMLERLKLCYLYAFDSNPQLELCKDIDYALVAILCIVSLTVLAQAAFRSLVLNDLLLCDGLVSDYKWSIWIIIVTQIAASFLASLGAVFRFLALSRHMKREDMGINWPKKDVDDEILYNPLLSTGVKGSSIVIFMYALNTIVVITELLVFKPFIILCKIKGIFVKSSINLNRDRDDDDDLREYQNLIHEGEGGLEEWIVRKGVESMRKRMQLNRDTVANRLDELISNLASSSSQSSQESLIEELMLLADVDNPYKLSSLSIVLLVRIAILSTPTVLHASLKEILTELFEVIHFVERKMYFTNFESKKKSKLAKAAFAGQDFNYDIFKLVIKKTNGEILRDPVLTQAMKVINILEGELPSSLVQNEVVIITRFVKQRNYNSIQELYSYIQRLFIDMLNDFLVQLPNAIYKEIIESNPEDFEENIRFALKVLWKVKSLENRVPWLYPAGTNITNLITSTPPTTPTSNSISSASSDIIVNDQNGAVVLQNGITHDITMNEQNGTPVNDIAVNGQNSTPAPENNDTTPNATDSDDVHGHDSSEDEIIEVE